MDPTVVEAVDTHWCDPFKLVDSFEGPMGVDHLRPVQPAGRFSQGIDALCVKTSSMHLPV